MRYTAAVYRDNTRTKRARLLTDTYTHMLKIKWRKKSRNNDIREREPVIEVTILIKPSSPQQRHTTPAYCNAAATAYSHVALCIVRVVRFRQSH